MILIKNQNQITGHIRKSTIGRPDFANSADLELHATQRPKAAVGGQQKTSQTVVAQLSETQVSSPVLLHVRVFCVVAG